MRPSPTTPAVRGRDRYLDLLRAIALVRIITYHAFGWPSLTLIYPSLGVMFALAGSLMARSLQQRSTLPVIRDRMRRVLVPFWVFGAFVVPAMLLHGWRPDSSSNVTAWRSHLVLWLLPLDDPPFSPWAWQVNAPVWYIRTYLWFILLSPLLLLVFRRRPWLSIAGFLLLIFLLQSGVLLTGDAGALGRILTDIATFGPCWLLGFAHRDGLICRLRPAVVCCVALAALVLGGWYAFSHPTAQGYDLGEIPFAQAYWSFGFVLLLLRFQPRSMAWLARVRWLDRVVSFFNARAVTIYLWHEVALIASVAVIVWMWSVPFLAHSLPLGTNWWKYTLTWPLLFIPVLLFGWAEDIAARRRPRLWPWSDEPLNRRRRRHRGDKPLP